MSETCLENMLNFGFVLVNVQEEELMSYTAAYCWIICTVTQQISGASLLALHLAAQWADEFSERSYRF